MKSDSESLVRHYGAIYNITQTQEESIAECPSQGARSSLDQVLVDVAAETRVQSKMLMAQHSYCGVGAA